MGTHGKVILKANGKSVHIYNHFDSYPSHLGVKLIGYLLTLLKTYADTTQPTEALVKIKQRIEQCIQIPENRNESDMENLKKVLSLYYPKDQSGGENEDLVCMLEKVELFDQIDANFVEMMKDGFFLVTSPENFAPINEYRLCMYEYIYTLDFDLEEFVVVCVDKKIKAVYPFTMITEDNASLLMNCVDCTKSISLNEL